MAAHHARRLARLPRSGGASDAVFDARQLRADATARRLPALLPGHPAVTMNQIASAMDTPYGVANRAVKHRVAHGILREPARRRNGEVGAALTLPYP